MSSFEFDLSSENSWSNEIIIDKKSSSNNLINQNNDDSDIETYEQLDDLIPSPNIHSKSNYNFERIESFESKLPANIPKDKKMSLLMVVLLQMVFTNNDEKLNKIYNFLNKKNILDLEVTTSSYIGIRTNLSFMIESLNNFKQENTIEKFN
jgi:hypothetical protein